MKRFREYAIMAVLSILISGAVSAGVYYGAIQPKQMSQPSYEEMGAESMSNAVNNYGFKTTSLSMKEAMQVGSAPDLVPAAEKSVHAVVHIKIKGSKTVTQQYFDPFDFFFGGDGQHRQSQTRPVVGYGSGVIISSDGYIITNNHVIEDADEMEVTLNDNRTFKAEKIGTDPDTDIALIKIDAKDLPTIPFGNSDDLRLGEWVLAVGNPFNLTSTVTAGIVSAKARSAGTPDGKGFKIGGFIQTDAAVNAGNSGGALVNARGELVGINTMIYSQTGNYAGYSFAVPINTAAKVVADIKKYGNVQRAILGILGRDVDKDLREKYDLKVNSGAFVADFSPVSPAYAAGIEKEDVIVAIDGRRVNSFTELQNIIAMRRPGDKAKLTVDRKGKEKVFTVTLKNTQGDESVVKAKDAEQAAGISLEELSAKARRQYGIAYGVQVTNVSNKNIRRIGINKGFIILSIDNVTVKDVKTATSLIQNAMQAPRGQRSIMVRGFYPNGKIKTYLVELD